MENLTVVDYHGEDTSHCGYCMNSFGAVSHGMSTYSMTPLDYQSLIDRGWRRSGKYCYKPVMNKTCCPQYTIRCRALEYSLTKSQKKVLRRVRRFLMSDDYSEMDKWRSKFAVQQSSQSDCEIGQDVDVEEMTISQTEDRGLFGYIGNIEQRQDLGDSKTCVEENASAKRKVTPGFGQDFSKPPCRKAKLARLEMKATRQGHSGKGDASTAFKKIQPALKSLPELIPHINPDASFRKKFEIRMVQGMVGNSNFEATRKESHAVYQKYQQVIHGADPIECGEKQWIRCLVTSSLISDPSGPGPGYGNYHQQYLLDGKIIAVGVVDILPNCLSSVYLYYDSDYGFMSLGIYSALSEIAYTQQLHAQSTSLQYYYMGFYIHNCQKMKYKAGYPPSDLLCPETYQWVPVSLCRPALDKQKYLRLNVLNGGSPETQDCLRGCDFNQDNLCIVYRQDLMKYDIYKSLRYSVLNVDVENATEDEKRVALRQKRRLAAESKVLKEFVLLVGTECAKRTFISL